MSILDVTEDDIFSKLGKGKDPNFKPIEKVRPVMYAPKKTYAPVQQTGVRSFPETVKFTPSPEVEEAIKKLTEELSLMNKSVGGIQAMIKLYIFLFTIAMIIFIATLGVFIKYYVF
jgi:hypothetical protein